MRGKGGLTAYMHANNSILYFRASEDVFLAAASSDKEGKLSSADRPLQFPPPTQTRFIGGAFIP